MAAVVLGVGKYVPDERLLAVEMDGHYQPARGADIENMEWPHAVDLGKREAQLPEAGKMRLGYKLVPGQ